MNAGLKHLFVQTCSALSHAECRESPTGLEDILAGLPSEMTQVEPQIPAHSTLLDHALNEITNPDLAPLREALAAAKHALHWRVDDGGFYPAGADLGEGYIQGNMHALLAGPQDAPFRTPDFLLGYFLLQPQVLYRDHKHLSPEVYVPLTGPTGWRFGQGPWRDIAAGSLVYNAPEVVHATRVYDAPFLAIFAWLRDIHHRCEVVQHPDWALIEADLHLRRWPPIQAN